MASRESYKISNYWKYPRGHLNRRYRDHVVINIMHRFRSVFSLFKRSFKYKHEREMFIIDNIKVPFNKIIGCRLTKHNWFYMDDEERAFCTKCHKDSGYISRDIWDRREKLDKIKKRVNK